MFVRLVCRSAGLAALLACGVCGAGVIAVSPAPMPPGGEAAARDLRMTLRARRLLLADAELAQLNLGVRVRDRVAYLWGPVPSVELSFKAEICLREMFELTEVRNQMFVSGDEPAKPAPPAPSFLPAAAAPSLPGLPSDKVMQPPPPVTRPRPVVEPPPVQEEEIELPPLRLPQPKTPAPKG